MTSVNLGLPAKAPCPPTQAHPDVQRVIEGFDAARGGEAPAGDQRDILAALAIFAAYSPYLSTLAQRDPTALTQIVAQGPAAFLDALWPDLTPAATAGLTLESLMRLLRRAKAQVALATAVGDLMQGWPLLQTTRALSHFAGLALRVATAHVLRDATAKNELTLADPADPESRSGLIVLAMGKLGAGELNYSSDIDLIVFYDDDVIRPTGKREPSELFVRLTKTLVKIIQERTADGYVFRVDLRLRPDPGAMPIALSTDTAENYYQSLGQNWERAAMIKALPLAGDIEAGHDFLQRIRPFVWRKHLDFAAVRDIQRMKEKIRDHHGHGDIGVEGHDVKLGPGGIREVEFFVQIQQLISGGRDPALRQPATLAMLDHLAATGRLPPADRDTLTAGYCFLRHLEHRLQMVEDAQTHKLPESPDAVAQIGRFMGYDDAAAFRADLLSHLAAIQRRFTALFEAEDAADPIHRQPGLPRDEAAMAERLASAGFKEPGKAASIVTGWRVGRYRCFRHERARTLVEGLAPVLMAALARTGEPDSALVRLDQFLSRLPAGVQLFSLLDANRALLDLLAEIMGSAPLLAETLSRRPGLLDSVVGGEALRPITMPDPLRRELDTALCDVTDYQDVLDSVRRWTADRRFAVGIQLLRGLIDHAAAGQALTLVADIVIERLLATVSQAFQLAHGRIPGGGFAVLGFGKLGGRELTVTSDLDLVFVFSVPDGTVGSDGAKPLTPGLYYTRLGQRLIAAMSALTAEGSLYEVDMALRPAGSKGPLVTTLNGFGDYYRGEAWTWEHLALTRARLVGADGAAFADQVEALLDRLKRLPRDPGRVRGDIAAMRGRMDKDRPARDRWDLKLCPGGLVDIEFIVQTLMLVTAARQPPPLPTETAGMIARLLAQGELDSAQASLLGEALHLTAGLSAMLRLTAGDPFVPDQASDSLKVLLARQAGVADFAALTAALDRLQPAVRSLFATLVGDPASTYVQGSGAGSGALEPLGDLNDDPIAR